MNIRIVILVVVYFSFSAGTFSQIKNGLRVGTNISWYSQTVDEQTFLQDGSVVSVTTDYNPKIGFQVGYLWSIDMGDKLSLTLEAMLNLYRIGYEKKISIAGVVPGSGNSIVGYGPSLPLTFNYKVEKNIFLSAGYEVQYRFDAGASNTSGFDHLGAIGGGVHTKYGDLSLKMMRSISGVSVPASSSFGYTNDSYYNYRMDKRYLQVMQLTVTLPLKSGYRRQKERDGQ